MSQFIDDIEIPSLHDRVGPEEWQARVELAACYRLVAHHGWAGRLGSHISARVPGEKDHFLLNPYGLLFEEITASSLIKVDMDGKILSESPFPVNKAGVAIHSAIYLARPDVVSALHTHTNEGVAISILECGLLTLSQTAMRFHKRIAYHDFAGPADAMDDRDRLGGDLGHHMAMILRNHGLLTVGRTIGDAFVLMLSLEQAVTTQMRAMSTGAKLIELPEELCDVAAINRDGKNIRSNEAGWKAFMRMADRLDRSYRN